MFGFRASKMRHAKISSLIHSSSAQPNLTSCGVEVHFHDVLDDEHGSSAVVAGTELVVSRSAYKNNSSRYMINGRESNFTEVTTLLRNRGIDLDHKRFLILQGEVESIAQMKPKAENENDDGLLEYLEDIIGTSDYKKPIEETQAQVESLNEDCVEKTSRLQIVEKELKSLEGQRDQIIKFLEIENDLTLKRSALCQLYIHLCSKRIELSTKVIEEQQVSLKEELVKTDQNKRKVQELTDEHKSKSKELEKFKKQVQEMSKLLSKQEIAKVQTEEKKKHLEAKHKKLEKTIKGALHSRNESQTWLDNYEQESENLSDQLKELELSLKKENIELEKIQNELKDKTQVFTDEIEKTQRLLEPWRLKISAKESEIAVAQSQADLLKEKADSFEATLNESKEKIMSIKKQGREKEQHTEELKQELEHVTSQIKLGVDECNDASAKLIKMRQNVSTQRQALSDSKQSVNEFQSQNNVLAGLMKLSDSSRIQGFHGRLGRLGIIDQKYDVAISTACPSLDNIVVETVDTGQQCIEYLRKNNLGRAKFILLDRLPKQDLSRIETPENVPRLFDLVKPNDPMFAPAFFSVLGNTLVAKDAEQARRIAYSRKRWRVVTLDGMLVDTSGTMSGGGTTVKVGGMKNKAVQAVSQSKFKEMETKLQEHEERLQLAEATFMKMETALKELQERKPAIELDISKSELEIQSLAKSLEEAQNQYNELARENQAGSSNALKEWESVTKIVTKLESELQELKAHTQDLEQTIADLQEKIMEAGGVRLRLQMSKVDGMKDQIQLCNTRLTNGVMEKTKAQNEVKKYTRIIESSEKELAESEVENQHIASKWNDMLAETQRLEAEVEADNDTLSEKQEALDQLKSELNTMQKEINSMRSTEIEIENTIEQHQKSLKEDTRSRKNYVEQLNGLSLHDIADLKGVKIEKKPGIEPMIETESERMEEDEDEDDDDHEEREIEIPASQNNNDSPTCIVEYSPDELASFNKDELKREIAALEETNQNAKIDMQVLRDYRRRLEEYQRRKDDLNESVAKRDSIKKQCDDLKQKRLDEFMTGFNTISMKLKDMYQMITMGGNAELELVDSLDPFSEGIIFSVMPPKKSWRNISNLSGGEKTLSSLALVFALHHYKPTPLYVMDEIDAALDFRNVSIVATYIKERTKHGQFIVISLRNNMFELARQLVGIYKVNNMTKSIALQNRSMV